MLTALLRSSRRWLPVAAVVSAVGVGLPAFAQDGGQGGGQAGQPAGEQPGEQKVPTPEEIFERHIEAVGGREQVFSIKDRLINGTFEGEPFKFPARLRIVTVAPNKMVWEASEPAGMGIKIVYNGELGWREQQMGSGKPFKEWVIGPSLVDLMETADFFGEANYKERYKELTLAGTADFYGTTVYVIRGIRNSGKMHLLMFSIQTGLFIGSRTAVLHSDREMRPLDVRLENYEEFGGVLYPTRMVQQFRGETRANVFEFNRVRVNTGEEFNWAPPVDMPPYPKLDENFMPVEEGEGP